MPYKKTHTHNHNQGFCYSSLSLHPKLFMYMLLLMSQTDKSNTSYNNNSVIWLLLNTQQLPGFSCECLGRQTALQVPSLIWDGQLPGFSCECLGRQTALQVPSLIWDGQLPGFSCECYCALVDRLPYKCPASFETDNCRVSPASATVPW